MEALVTIEQLDLVQEKQQLLRGMEEEPLGTKLPEKRHHRG